MKRMVAETSLSRLHFPVGLSMGESLACGYDSVVRDHRDRRFATKRSYGFSREISMEAVQHVSIDVHRGKAVLDRQELDGRIQIVFTVEAHDVPGSACVERAVERCRREAGRSKSYVRFKQGRRLRAPVKGEEEEWEQRVSAHSHHPSGSERIFGSTNKRWSCTKPDRRTGSVQRPRSENVQPNNAGA